MALLELSMATLQQGVLSIIVGLVAGLALLVVGYAFAVIVEALLKKAFAKAKVEEKLKETGLESALLGFTLSGIIIGLIKWIIFLWFLAFAVNVIEAAFLVFMPGATPALAPFFVEFVQFLPSVLQGILVLIVGMLLADFLANKVSQGLTTQAGNIATAVKVVVVYFTVVIALSNPAYGLDISIITNIFNYLVIALAVGMGGGLAIALGLGLKDSVSRVAKKHEVSIERSIVGKMKR